VALLIGPLLRRVSGRRASIWIETDAPATVEVRAGPARGTAGTFCAYGHHYALVLVDGLPLGATTPYEVLLDGELAWPLPDSPLPPSLIRTRAVDAPVRIVFGSCREASNKSTGRRFSPDALSSYAARLARSTDPLREWPDTLMLLGDQVYADEPSPPVRRWLRWRRRSSRKPADQVVSFEEYTRLYLESWTDPEVRWLLSTVPSTMIFDDHEVIDDWNTSASWLADVTSQPWWNERITAALASYWVYQHLGNIDPEDVATDPVYAKVAGSADATRVLRELAADTAAVADPAHDRQREDEYRWSFSLDIGATRIAVLDTRASRVLDPPHRAMLPDSEWQWLDEQVTAGGYDHLVVGSSLPWLLAPALHHVEAWNERVAASARERTARVGERLRRGLDLEHWAAFGRSFEQLCAVVRRVGTGAYRPPPASVSVLSGDVHHSYVARADLGPDVRSAVYQLTCSPIHNQLPRSMRPLMRLGWGRLAGRTARALARTAGVPPPTIRWQRLAGPYYGNAIASIVYIGQSASVTIEGVGSDGHLSQVAEVSLT
jgi:hypothetical protein